MGTINLDYFRTQLLDRRAKLESAQTHVPDSHELGRLMSEVDAALSRIDTGTYGLCEACHDAIESERLLRDPLITLCLDHLTSDQRRSLEEDLGLAVRVQAKLLPDPGLSSAGWETYYRYLPAGPVSGDFCDLIPCEGEPKRLFFVLGDVAGKGVAASLLMSHFHAILRTLVPLGMPLTQMLHHANKIFCEGTMTSHYATVICGYADRSGQIEICNAGHCQPLLYRDGLVTTVEAGGLPMGLFCQSKFESSVLQLKKGDSLLIYTDGITEARDPFDMEYGPERLAESFARCAGASPQATVGACLSNFDEFLRGAPRRDDVTLMVVRRDEYRAVS